MKLLSLLKFYSILITSVFLISCGGSSSSEATAPVPSNTKPIAIISPAGNQTINVGDIINFKGDSSSDADGNTPLTYQWIFSGAATSIQSSTSENPGDITFSEAGTVTISLIVTDSLGLASNQTSLNVEVSSVNNNQAPVGSISHDNGDGSTGTTTDITITEGTNIIFDSAITDPENDVISYAWNFEGATPAASSSAGNISVNYANKGSYTVTLVATDVNGNGCRSFRSTKIAIRSFYDQ